MTKKLAVAISALGLMFSSLSAQAQTRQVQVEITNNAPSSGVAITPVWVGFHDGSFDSYNGGLSSQIGVERIAEDGDTAPLSGDFLGGYTYIDGSGQSNRVLTSQTSGRVDGTLAAAGGPPPLQPGETTTMTFTIDLANNQYFSYASMILPSSDFFIANGNPVAHNLSALFSGSGSISFDIGLAGTVNDAGTEVDDFATSPGNPLFGLPAGQSAPDQGAVEDVNIANVVGNPYSNFLNSPSGFDFSALNFNEYSSGVATITISTVPEPSSFGLLGFGLGGLLLARRRRR